MSAYMRIEEQAYNGAQVASCRAAGGDDTL